MSTRLEQSARSEVHFTSDLTSLPFWRDLKGGTFLLRLERVVGLVLASLGLVQLCHVFREEVFWAILVKL